MALPEPPLLIITDRSQATRPLTIIAEDAFRAGARWLSLREKDLPPDERRALLAQLVRLGERWDATVTVHEDFEAALATGAAGIHLPRGGNVAAARSTLGAGTLIGVSTHDEGEIALAEAAGADYATVSPIFPSESKPGRGASLALEGFAAIAGSTSLPLLALSGVTPETAPDALAAGAAGLAVMGAVMRARDPGAMVAALIGAMQSVGDDNGVFRA